MGGRDDWQKVGGERSSDKLGVVVKSCSLCCLVGEKGNELVSLLRFAIRDQ